MRSLSALSSCLLAMLLLSSCATQSPSSHNMYSYTYEDPEVYASRIPQFRETGGERLVVVDPNVHVWGAYEKNGELVKAGIATAGGEQCPPDEPGHRSCRTSVGTFRVSSLGDGGCFSKIYPRPNGGGLMPYCMFFHGGQALHGSPDGTVVENNISHGCVRMRIPDAEWLRYNFVRSGTKVIVEPY